MEDKYYNMFKEIYGIELRDHGISVEITPNVHIFDIKKKTMVFDVKCNRMTSMIRNKLSVRLNLFMKMINPTTLKPQKQLESLFTALFPSYTVRTSGNIALASGVDGRLLFFRKDINKYEEPVALDSTHEIHQSLRGYILPLVYSKNEVKPREYISNRTLTYARKANEMLTELGFIEHLIYVTDSGLILECGEKDTVVVSADSSIPKRGDKNSLVYKEYMLLKRLIV